MLLSHKYKFIFIHIPKTGGTSVKDALLPFSDMIYSMPWKHRTAKYWKPNFPFWDDYFKFAFVRNPWDRMVSRRFYQKHVNPSEEARAKGDACETFEEFLALPRSMHIINQSQYIYDGDDCLLDFVGKYENFQEDFDVVCDRIGVEHIELPHLNDSPRNSDYRGYYDAKTQKIVENLCHDDIIRYDYAF